MRFQLELKPNAAATAATHAGRERAELDADVQQLSTQVDGLRRARFLKKLSHRENKLEELLESVASMSETRVQALLRELRMEGRS